MSDCSVKEECVCGTIFEVSGSASFSAARYEEYLKNHKKCLETRQVKMSTSSKEDYDIPPKSKTVEKMTGEI
jgi:hypothetical protein